MSRIRKSIETENSLVVTRIWGRGLWFMITNEYTVSLSGNKNVPELDNGDDYTNL